MKATTREIREAVEFAERYVIFKSNRHQELGNDYFPIRRKPRESFVNFALRFRKHFRGDIPRLRMRRRR